MSFAFNTCLKVLESKSSPVSLLNSLYVILNSILIVRIRILTARDVIAKGFSDLGLLTPLSVV